MTNDLMLGGVYILMAMMLVLGALMVRREPGLKLVKMALAGSSSSLPASSSSHSATISAGWRNG